MDWISNLSTICPVYVDYSILSETNYICIIMMQNVYRVLLISEMAVNLTWQKIQEPLTPLITTRRVKTFEQSPVIIIYHIVPWFKVFKVSHCKYRDINSHMLSSYNSWKLEYSLPDWCAVFRNIGSRSNFKGQHSQ